MFTLLRPTHSVATLCLFRQRKLPFSYTKPGATQREEVPRGYRGDRYRVCLGVGKETYEVARVAIQRWKMFPTEIVDFYWRDISIEEGSTVAVVFRAGFLWSLNPCRIVYTIDETSGSDVARVERYGFAYGTLPAHVIDGEERFTVEWRRGDDSVWYDQTAFFRPSHWLAHVGYPLIKMKQQRFRQLSGNAMQRAVSGQSD